MDAVTRATEELVQVELNEREAGGSLSLLTIKNTQTFIDNAMSPEQVYAVISNNKEEIFIDYISGPWRISFNIEDDYLFGSIKAGNFSSMYGYVIGKDKIPYETFKLQIDRMTVFTEKANPNWRELFTSN